jgi:carbamoyltransferase
MDCSGCSRNPRAEDDIEQRVKSEFARDAETRRDFETHMDRLGVDRQRIKYFDHHQSHAWSAFACSPFEKALVFTFDGRGDLKSGSASVADTATGIQEWDYNLSLDSLGFLYGQITHYLGFQPHRHEGKVTGLAAHGDPAKTKDLFENLISFDGERIVSNLGHYRPFYTNMTDELKNELDEHSREDIAAGLQTHCENLVVEYIRYWIPRMGRTDIRDVCLAGGLFANVKINQAIYEMDEVDNIYVFPHIGDGGLGVGAACNLNFVQTGAAKVLMPDVYLGPSYSTKEIEAAIRKAAGQLHVEQCSDLVEPILQDLQSDKVVGFFYGRMELGPRALGARSILCHARDDSINDRLNARLHRTEFMPFAPVTPEGLASQCYLGWRPDNSCALTMTQTYRCTDSFRQHHPAVVHVDGTARPQIVTRERNGRYGDLVERYCERTGDKALINTSFNQHEEPIVCSPEDAIGSLISDNVDIIAIGDFRLQRRSK